MMWSRRRCRCMPSGVADVARVMRVGQAAARRRRNLRHLSAGQVRSRRARTRQPEKRRPEKRRPGGDPVAVAVRAVSPERSPVVAAAAPEDKGKKGKK
eukprot:254372-Pyramimonas_sp.AAC.1